MSDALPAVGAHCSLSSCNLNDFLPIRCACQALFCRDHIAPEVHQCPLLDAKPEAAQEGFSRLQRCAAQSCNKPSLESFIADPTDTTNRKPALCSGCHQAFCAGHREPASHACNPPPPDPSAGFLPEKNAAAKALLAKHFGSPPTRASSSSKPHMSSKKQAAQRQVTAMKMRHQAQPGDPKDAKAAVPMNERVHLRVGRPDTETERVFWFRKTIGTGRALDMLATHFGLVVSDSQPLSLLSSEDATILRMDQPLGDQISDGSSLSLSR